MTRPSPPRLSPISRSAEIKIDVDTRPQIHGDYQQDHHYTDQHARRRVSGFAIHFAFKLDPGSTTLGGSNPDFGVILSQWTNLSGTDDTLLFAYCDSTNPLGVSSIPASNFLTLTVTNGQSGGEYRQQVWTSQIDPFAGMAGDGKWHYLTLEWRQYDATFSSEGGYSLLSIDGVTLSNGRRQRQLEADEQSDHQQYQAPAASARLRPGDSISLAGDGRALHERHRALAQ